MATPTFNVFLSHNSQDKPTVRELAEALKRRKLRVWLDEDELRPGLSWQQGLEEGVRSSTAVVVVVGNDGLGPWEVEEMEGALVLAVKNKLPVVPVLLPGAPGMPALPLFLTTRTWVDLRGGLTQAGLDRLHWGITGVKQVDSVEIADARRPFGRDQPTPEADGGQVEFEWGLLALCRPWQTWTDEGVHPKTSEQLDVYRRELLDAKPTTAPQASQAARTAHVLAMALRQDKQYDEAASTLGRALSLGKQAIGLDRYSAQLDERFYGVIYNAMGTIRKLQGRPDDAEQEFRKAIEFNPNDPKPHSNLGRLLMGRGSRDEGLLALKKACELSPNEEHGHYLLGMAHQEVGQLDQAERELARAAELAPSDYFRDLYSMDLAKVLLKARAPERALTAFVSARATMGAAARIGEAVALRLADRPMDAIRVLAEAINADPQLPDAHGQLGVTLWQQGRLADGIAAMRRAALLSLDYADWQVNLGMALVADGRPDEARVPLERALVVNPSNEAAINALARLPKRKF